MDRGAIKKLCGAFLTLALYVAVSAFVLHLFMVGNGWFRETNNGFSFDRMLSFTADRPFAYRVLVPLLVNGASALFPQSFVHGHARWLLHDSPLVPYAKTALFMNENLALKVHIEFVYVFLSLVLLLYTARAITQHVYRFPGFFSAATPAAALLLLPSTFRWGSHIYDFPELLLIGLSLLCLLKKQWACYYIAYALAVLTKEVNVLLPVFFIALWQDRLPKKNLLRHAGLQMLVGAVLVLAVRYAFADNPLWPEIDTYWKQNLKFWLNPASYLLFWDAYNTGLPYFPRASNILFIGGALFLVLYRWREKPAGIKRLLLYSSAVNIPLFLYAGWADEIRTLALMFPGIYLLGAYSLCCLLYPAWARQQTASCR